MSILIKIDQSKVGNESIQTVNARELHGFLESKRNFADWIKDRIDSYGFIAGEDFTDHKFVIGRATQIDYHITIDMAKELAMVERNAKGKEARQYFLECERRAKAAAPLALPQTFAAALRALADSSEKVAALETKIVADAPKIVFAEAVRDLDGVCPVEAIAKTLGTGRNKFFKRLREDSVLMANNLPYQKYIDREYFKVVEHDPWVDSRGNTHPVFTPMVTGRGQVWLQHKYSKTIRVSQKGARA